MQRQAEKRQQRGACAVVGPLAVWWESGLSVIGNVNVVQRSGKGAALTGGCGCAPALAPQRSMVPI